MAEEELETNNNNNEPKIQKKIKKLQPNLDNSRNRYSIDILFEETYQKDLEDKLHMYAQNENIRKDSTNYTTCDSNDDFSPTLSPLLFNNKKMPELNLKSKLERSELKLSSFSS